MKCLRCNRMFEPSAEEYARVKGLYPLDTNGFTYVECSLPQYCSWECYKAARGAEESEREKKRWEYHIGERGPKPMSAEARREEEEYRERMREDCRVNPPRFARSSFSEDSRVHMTFPSQRFYGGEFANVELTEDEATMHLGGEDGEKFNFENE